MYEWIASLAAVIMVFTGYQFWQYCREEKLNVTECIAKLYKKFVADLSDIFPGPRA
jgi:hypothetical protein